MIKQKTILEAAIDGRVYQFECPQDAPLGEIHDVLVYFRGIVVKQIDDAMKSHEKPKEEKVQE